MNTSKFCPSCNTENPIAASFCRHCRYEFSEESKNGESLIPKIVSFEILDKDYCEGSKIRVSWDVQGVNELWLNGKEVTDRSDYNFKVQKTRTLTLRAKNEYSETHKEIILRPSRVASIVNFSANRSTVEYGDAIQLRWDVRDAQAIRLIEGNKEIDVTSDSGYKVTPDKNTEYTLVAISKDTNIKESAVVRVKVIPKIKSFTVEDRTYCIGSTIRVSWDVRHADRILLNGNNVTGRNYYDFKVADNHILKLEATNEDATKTSELRLSPEREAKVLTFTANKDYIKPGQDVQLQWDCQHSVRTILRYDGIESEVNNHGVLNVYPNKRTYYSVIAYSVDGTIYDKKTLAVDVVEPVIIETFETNHNQIVESTAIRLSWQVRSAEKIELYHIHRADIARMHLGITPKCEDVTGRTSIELRPVKDTEYRLHVSNRISSDDAYLDISVHQLPKMDVSIPDVLTLPELPKLNVELPDFTGQLKSSGVNKWLTTEPMNITNKSIWDRSIFKKLSQLLKFRV